MSPRMARSETSDGEGRLAALRLRLALGDHRAVVVAPGAVAKLAAEPRAEGPLQRRGLGARRARPPCGSRAGPAAAAVRGPTPGIRVAGRSPTASSMPSGSSTQRPSGFSRSEAILASSLLGARPDRADQARLGVDLALQLAGARLRRRAVGEVQIGLVQAGDLDPVAEPAQDLHHLARGAPVQPDVARDQGRLRAAPVGDRQRQRRVDAEARAPRRRRPSPRRGRRRRSRSRPRPACRAAPAGAGAPRRRRTRPCPHGRRLCRRSLSSVGAHGTILGRAGGWSRPR